MFILKRSRWLVFLLALAACVTVNIYFPAAAAEKAADKIIEDVWKQNTINTKDTTTSQSPLSFQDGQPTITIYAGKFLASIFSAVSNTAHAQVDFNANSPEVSTIKAKIASRFPQLSKYYNNGAVGLTKDGYVALRDPSVVPMAERARVQQLVNSENADRKALYTAIAKANNQPSWAEQIRKTFAERWFAQAQSGWWVQTASGWKQK